MDIYRTQMYRLFKEDLYMRKRVIMIFAGFTAAVSMIGTGFFVSGQLTSVYAAPWDEQEIISETEYGFPGAFDEAAADNTCISFSEGTTVIEDTMMKCHQETAIENSEDSVLILNRSYVTDSVLPMMTMDTGKSFILNSTVQSTSGGAVFAGLAVPAEEDAAPLAVYAYGSMIDAANNSNGIYTELLSSAYVYGSHVIGADAGIESNTYGSIIIGSTKDAEENEALQTVLSEHPGPVIESGADTKSIVESNRNAIVITSTNDPDFAELDGFSESILAQTAARVTIRNSEIRTVKPASRSARWQQEETEYMKHTKGSVILVKSTNADISVENCTIEAYKNGNILQTVLGDDDPEYLMLVSDGEEVPGIHVSFAAMELNGNIVHEDYQRDLNLELSAVTWNGAANEYDVQHWNQVAEEEEFEDLCVDDSYETHHGISISLQDGSVWNVTEESVLSRLTVGEGCTVNGVITVDGETAAAQEGEFTGNILVSPAE